MAYTFVRVAAPAVSQAALATNTLTVGASGVALGDLLIIAVCANANVDPTGITDTAGNTYTKLKPGTAVGTTGQVSVWASVISSALVSGNTIVVTFAAAQTSAVSATEWSGGQLTVDVNAGTGSAADTNPPTVSVTTGKYTPGDLVILVESNSASGTIDITAVPNYTLRDSIVSGVPSMYVWGSIVPDGAGGARVFGGGGQWSASGDLVAVNIAVLASGAALAGGVPILPPRIVRGGPSVAGGLFFFRAPVAVATAAITAAWQDVALRFRLSALTFKDVALRFGLSVRSYKDAALRFALSSRAYKDIQLRFRLSSTAFKDVGLRFGLAVRGYKDAALRFRLAATAFKDVGLRFRLSVRAFKDVALRFRLSALTFKDIGLRFRLAALTWKDVGLRFRLSVRAFKDIVLRFRLSAQTWKDVGLRFTLVTAIPSFKDVALRFRLSALTYKDVALRFRLSASAWKDVPLRFRLSVAGFKDVGLRFRSVATGYKDVGLRFRLSSGVAAAAADIIYLLESGRMAVLVDADVYMEL